VGQALKQGLPKDDNVNQSPKQTVTKLALVSANDAPCSSAHAETATGKQKSEKLFVSWDGFRMSYKGLWLTKRTSNKDDEAESNGEWISAPFEILGASRDPSGGSWGKRLRWQDNDKRPHLRHVTDAALHGDPAALCAMLADQGLTISRGHHRAFVTYLTGAPTEGRVTIVHRTGWHDIKHHDKTYSAFVLPTEAIGPEGAGTVMLDLSAHGPYEARGSLEDWQNGAGKLSAGHALAVLAISAALAGPLLHLARQEGGGIHFYGASSRGKTTLLQLGASVWGRGGSPGYVRAWRATANGLEGAAASATDTALVLDEFGAIEAREAASALYSLSNGGGKARATRTGELREPKSWRLLFLSSGEIPVETKLGEERGRTARAGQLVRMLGLPADRERGFGVFDNGGPSGDASKLAQELKRAAISNYGTAGPEFVRRLIAGEVTGEDVQAHVAQFVAQMVPAGADGQIERAAQRFGLIATAGELATTLGVTPWRPGEAREAAAWALGRWIEERGGTEPAEAHQAIAQVRRFIEQARLGSQSWTATLSDRSPIVLVGVGVPVSTPSG
jgi:putative DNA primase/helicase